MIRLKLKVFCLYINNLQLNCLVLVFLMSRYLHNRQLFAAKTCKKWLTIQQQCLTKSSVYQHHLKITITDKKKMKKSHTLLFSYTIASVSFRWNYRSWFSSKKKNKITDTKKILCITATTGSHIHAQPFLYSFLK